MGRYMINGKPGMDPRPRFECAVCPGCQQVVDVIEPRHLESAARATWRDAQHAQGLLIRGSMYRSRWREGDCTCERG